MPCAKDVVAVLEVYGGVPIGKKMHTDPHFSKGQVMKLSKGKANPAMVGDLLAQKLG